MNRVAPWLFGLLVLASSPARADETAEVEVWSYRYGFDFVNEKQQNQFVVEEEGVLNSHALGNLEGAEQWLNERLTRSRELTKVVLRGQEIPADIVKAQAGALFTSGSRFEVESLGATDVSSLRRIATALESQFADDWVINALGMLCQRDWERLRREARGSGEIVWELPALYRAFHVQEENTAQGDIRKVTATLTGTFDGPMGQRELKEFRFTGLYDLFAKRFVHTELHGLIRNEEAGLQQTVSWVRDRGDHVRVDANERPGYLRGARGLAAAVQLAQADRHAESHAAFTRLKIPARLAATAKQHFAGVERFAGGVRWGEGREALAAAQARARSEQAPILVLVDQLNCPPCQIMHRTVLTDEDFVATVEDGFSPVRIDLCQHPDLIAQFEIRGTPTLLVLDADLNVIAREEGVAPLSQALGLLDEGRALFPR